MCAHDREEPSSFSASRSRFPRCDGIAILVVDGDESFRSGVVGILRDDGHPVTECPSPEALPPLECLPVVDAVLMDYPDSGGDRLEFARRFHRLHPSVPIVLATAQWSPALERAARGFGCVVRKPVDYEELHGLLHRLAARSTRRHDGRFDSPA